MPEQQDLFASIAARDEAIKRVGEGAGDTWMRMAIHTVADVAAEEGEFTTDEVWAEFERREMLPREPRAMGAVMKQAAAQGFICPTDRYRPSARPECHARPVKVWTRSGLTHPLTWTVILPRTAQ